VINSNRGPLSPFARYGYLGAYSLKLIIKNCGQTAADGDMVTIDGLWKRPSALSD